MSVSIEEPHWPTSPVCRASRHLCLALGYKDGDDDDEEDGGVGEHEEEDRDVEVVDGLVAAAVHDPSLVAPPEEALPVADLGAELGVPGQERLQEGQAEGEEAG